MKNVEGIQCLQLESWDEPLIVWEIISLDALTAIQLVIDTLCLASNRRVIVISFTSA